LKLIVEDYNRARTYKVDRYNDGWQVYKSDFNVARTSDDVEEYDASE
jgi:hypothetical protein